MSSNTRAKGPTGRRVAENLRRLRRNRGLSSYALAGLLRDEIDVTMDESTITRIERSERTVNVDDLAALALVLGVSPNGLLMPDMEIPPEKLDTDVPVSGSVVAKPRDLWSWATGEANLAVDHGRAEPTGSMVEQAQFVVANQPHHYSTTGTHGVIAGATGGVMVVLRELAYEAIGAGVSPDRLIGYFSRAVGDAERELNEQPI